MEKKVYKNVIRSKNAIEKALLSLLMDGHDLERISVSELCLRAGLNRGTFYNHFKNVDEVLTSLENEFMESLGAALKSTELTSQEGRKRFFDKTTAFLEGYKKDAIAIARYLPSRTFLDLKNKLNRTLNTSFPAMIGYVVVDEALLRKVHFFMSGLVGSYVDAITSNEDTIADVSEAAYEISNVLFEDEFKRQKAQ